MDENTPNSPNTITAQPHTKGWTIKLILGAIALVFIIGIARVALDYGLQSLQNGPCITMTPSNSSNTPIVLAYQPFSLPPSSSNTIPEIYYSSVEVHTSKGWVCTTDTGGLAGSAQEAIFFNLQQQPAAQIIAFAPVGPSEIDQIRFNVAPPPGSSLLVNNQTIITNVSSSGNVKPNNVVIIFVKPNVSSSKIPNLNTLNLRSPAAFVDTNITLSFGVIPGYGLEVGSQAFLDSMQLAEINASLK